MKRQIIWAILLIVLGIVGCGDKASQQHLSLKIEGISAEDTPWYLYSYGTHSITIDTIEVSRKGKIDWDKDLDLDSLDLLLLLNSKGLLEIPLLPSRTGNMSATINREGIALEGVQQTDSIQSWYRAKEEGMEHLLPFLSHYDSNELSLVMTVDAIHRDSIGKHTKELLDIQRKLSNGYSDIIDIIGFTYMVSRVPEPIQVPYGFRIQGEDNLKNFRELMDKRDLMVINVMELTPEDSIAFKQQKDYLSQLDSLKLLNYNVLLNDELPKGVTKGAHRHFLVDSTGYAIEYIRQYNIQQIPTYMLVDSTRHVVGSWEIADSLVQFVKDYKDVGGRVD